ncbi:polyketide cyclase [Mycolicibacterium sp. 018/SC-01/001]|uniref:SRPBCC family protein n=1 Tax=Mycolicibacterium sp. 018/SC-01/001 TaxID=2592069 RepID=UPI001180ACC2|nr:SRPBCC family protein [Mycolicibacterium sp. 018/SC-01/001]TRW82778.1 polyketide cyclase [Mycolicibacterium sp. 018/SC-01/001]
MTDTLILTTVADADPAAVFAVLADPAQHPAIDGTGWLRESLDPGPVTGDGQIFRIRMYHDNHPDGYYDMANKVIAYDRDRTIAWEPGQAGEHGEIEFGGWTWRHDLEPEDSGRTRVRLTYDWSRVPAHLREHITFPPFPTSYLEHSLANLAALASGRQLPLSWSGSQPFG